MTPPLPPGCVFNGPSEILEGRAVLMYTCTVTNSTFCVPENATEADVAMELRRVRDRFAGAAFAPVPL